MDTAPSPPTETYTFEDLACWQEARKFRLRVAREWVRQLPAVEYYRLADQLLRAARSITANIAEGYGRYHYLDTYRFCAHARGSCFEVLEHVITAVDEDLLPPPLVCECRANVGSVVKVLNGYMAFLRRRANQS